MCFHEWDPTKRKANEEAARKMSTVHVYRAQAGTRELATVSLRVPPAAIEDFNALLYAELAKAPS